MNNIHLNVLTEVHSMKGPFIHILLYIELYLLTEYCVIVIYGRKVGEPPF